MSDNEIRQILIEKKRRSLMQRREEARSFMEGFAGFGSMLIIGFMLLVIGG